MPIVLSYNDVNALGNLALQSGRLTGQADTNRQNLNLLAGIEANRNATAADLQRISASERQAEADRSLRRELAGAEQQYRYDTLAADQAAQRYAYDSRLAQEDVRGQYDLAQELLNAQTQATRDQTLHTQRLQQIEHQAAVRGSGAALSADGTPTREWAQQEVTDYGHLIPFRGAEAASVASAARDREDKASTAAELSALPTGQLEQMIQSRPSDPWGPYMRAIVQARRQVHGGGVPGAMGAQGDGRPVPSGRRPGIQGGGTFQSTPFSDLSDADLDALATNPALFQQYLSTRR